MSPPKVARKIGITKRESAALSTRPGRRRGRPGGEAGQAARPVNLLLRKYATTAMLIS